MNVKDHKMEMKMSSPWQKLSGSDYLHKLINDLNQSVINQMDLMFRRDFRLLVNNKFKENNLMEAEKFPSNNRYSNSNDFSTQQEQEKLITAYMHVLTSFVIAHNKALTIVLQCIGKPYKIIKPKEAKASGADKDEDNSKQQQKRMGIMEKTQMNPMQRTLAMQQELEAQLLDVESVEGRELDPDEEERYYQDLEMAQFRWVEKVYTGSRPTINLIFSAFVYLWRIWSGFLILKKFFLYLTLGKLNPIGHFRFDSGTFIINFVKIFSIYYF